jgi:hypothetical protein
MFNHQWRDRWNLERLIAQRIRIFSLKQRAAAAPGIGVVIDHRIHPFNRQQLRPGSGMARLAAALATTALAPLGWLKPGPIDGGRLGQLRKLRPIRSRGLASSLAKAESWLRSCSISCCWARMKARTTVGVANQSASEIPAGGAAIACSLCVRCTRESGCRQGFCGRTDSKRVTGLLAGAVSMG